MRFIGITLTCLVIIVLVAFGGGILLEYQRHLLALELEEAHRTENLMIWSRDREHRRLDRISVSQATVERPRSPRPSPSVDLEHLVEVANLVTGKPVAQTATLPSGQASIRYKVDHLSTDSPVWPMLKTLHEDGAISSLTLSGQANELEGLREDLEEYLPPQAKLFERNVGDFNGLIIGVR